MCPTGNFDCSCSTVAPGLWVAKTCPDSMPWPRVRRCGSCRNSGGKVGSQKSIRMLADCTFGTNTLRCVNCSKTNQSMQNPIEFHCFRDAPLQLESIEIYGFIPIGVTWKFLGLPSPKNWVILGTPKLPKIIDQRNVQVTFFRKAIVHHSPS